MTDRELMQQALDFLCSVMVHPSQIAARDAVADALEKKLAQPEQEPVAQVGMYSEVKALKPLPVGTHLYTTPPQRKPLSDEEIRSIAWGDFGVDQEKHQAEVLPLARAIEAKLREKNT